MRTTPLVLALFVFAPVLAEPATIYQCTDAKGNVVYQGDPCIEPEPTAPKPASPKPRASPPTQPSPARPSRVLGGSSATPESVLRTFVGAVKAGDRALVLSCLTSSALSDLGPGLAALPMDSLLETVTSFTGYISEGDLGPYWSIRALRPGTRPKWIFFERTISGEWKIVAF